jgi:hypothetical protein
MGEAASAAEATTAEAAANGGIGVGMRRQVDEQGAGCGCEPLARGRVESKKTPADLPAMHRAGEKIAAKVDGLPSAHVRF